MPPFHKSVLIKSFNFPSYTTTYECVTLRTPNLVTADALFVLSELNEAKRNFQSDSLLRLKPNISSMTLLALSFPPGSFLLLKLRVPTHRHGNETPDLFWKQRVIGKDK